MVVKEVGDVELGRCGGGGVLRKLVMSLGLR